MNPKLIPLLLLALINTVAAADVKKCTVGGKTIYTQAKKCPPKSERKEMSSGTFSTLNITMK